MSARFLITARIGRDTFKRDAYTLEYAMELFHDYTEDKSTQVDVFDFEAEKTLIESKRGKIIRNNLPLETIGL